MRTYTSCPGCGRLLFWHGKTGTHYGCDDPDYGRRLQAEFLAAAIAGEEEKADRLQARLDELDAAPPRLAESAAIYASWGWPVFPLQPGTKTPFPRSRGFKDATTDAATVTRWWTQAPQANIGVATGVKFDVLDIDFKHGAATVWPDLRESEAMPTCHGIAGTPSGGQHILLLPTGDGNAAGLGKLPGLDYRGVGGYIVAAPSVVDGRKYHWVAKPSPMLIAGAEVGEGAVA